MTYMIHDTNIFNAGEDTMYDENEMTDDDAVEENWEETEEDGLEEEKDTDEAL